MLFVHSPERTNLWMWKRPATGISAIALLINRGPSGVSHCFTMYLAKSRYLSCRVRLYRYITGSSTEELGIPIIITGRHDIHFSGSHLRHQMVDHPAGGIQSFSIPGLSHNKRSNLKPCISAPIYPTGSTALPRNNYRYTHSVIGFHQRLRSILNNLVQLRIFIITV